MQQHNQQSFKLVITVVRVVQVHDQEALKIPIFLSILNNLERKLLFIGLAVELCKKAT